MTAKPMNELEKTLDKNTYYWMSPIGLGDTLILAGYQKALETKLGGHIRFIVKPPHAEVMKMYGIHDYIVAVYNGNAKDPNNPLHQLAKECPIPTKGKIYVAHPDFHPALKTYSDTLQEMPMGLKFLDWYKSFLELPPQTRLEKPIYFPKLNKEVQKQVEKNGSLDHTVLLVPEANTLSALHMDFWEKQAADLQHKGYQVITSATRPEFKVKGIRNIETSLEQLIALAMSVKYVYALRSGLCDLIAPKGKNLFVFYSGGEKAASMYNLQEMFNRSDIHEFIIPETTPIKPKLLTKDLRKNALLFRQKQRC